MVLCFNNYYVKLKKDAISKLYRLTITKVTGPSYFDKHTIVESQIKSIDSLQEYIQKYIPQSQLHS